MNEMSSRKSELANLSSAKKSRIQEMIEDEGPIRLRATQNVSPIKPGGDAFKKTSEKQFISVRQNASGEGDEDSTSYLQDEDFEDDTEEEYSTKVQ